MKKAGIAIDAWKLSIFERHLGQGGYTFKNAGALTDGCLLLTVETENVQALAQVVLAANKEAARTPNDAVRKMIGTPGFYAVSHDGFTRVAVIVEVEPDGTVHQLTKRPEFKRDGVLVATKWHGATQVRGPFERPHMADRDIEILWGEA